MALDKITIVCVDGGKSDAPSENGSKTPNGKQSKLYKMLNLNQTIKNKMKTILSPTTTYAVQSGISVASQTAKQFINYYVSDVGRANGDSNYQSIVNRRIEQVTDALSIGQGALNGAGAGAWFGPLGAAVGAIAGTVSSGISLGFKYSERSRAYAHEMFKEDTNQAYNLARANYSISTGRLR